MKWHVFRVVVGCALLAARPSTVQAQATVDQEQAAQSFSLGGFAFPYGQTFTPSHGSLTAFEFAMSSGGSYNVEIWDWNDASPASSAVLATFAQDFAAGSVTHVDLPDFLCVEPGHKLAIMFTSGPGLDTVGASDVYAGGGHVITSSGSTFERGFDAFFRTYYDRETGCDDEDGVPAELEDGAPNGGDGNDDGTLDSIQAEVASLPSATGSYVTIELVEAGLQKTCPGLDNVEALLESDLGSDPDGLDYTYGLVGFTLACSSAQVKITYHDAGDLSGTTFRKYNSVTDEWFSMPGLIVDNTVTYDLVDGELGDSTGVDGVIVDPAGVAIPAVPALPHGVLAVLAALLLVGGAWPALVRRCPR